MTHLNNTKIEFSNQSVKEEWKKHFEASQLSHIQKQTLESALLSTPISITPPAPQPLTYLRLFSFVLSKVPSQLKVGLVFSHITTAALTVGLTTIIFLSYFKLNSHSDSYLQHDVISEVAKLSENLNFPADFDLDGNLNDLPALINDSLPSHSFHPTIPQKIAQDFSAYEGRFFLFNGEQGVGISILPTHTFVSTPLQLQGNFQEKPHSTLYIVKLSEKNKYAFPMKKMTGKVLSASGKIKRVYAWRDGTYGYAMIQPIGRVESDSQALSPESLSVDQ